jgi:hypothetical protein
MKFVETEPRVDLDVMIFKLEALKTMLKTDELGEFILAAKLSKKVQNDEQDKFEDYLGDDIPHYYGSDGQMIIGKYSESD